MIAYISNIKRYLDSTIQILGYGLRYNLQPISISDVDSEREDMEGLLFAQLSILFWARSTSSPATRSLIAMHSPIPFPVESQHRAQVALFSTLSSNAPSTPGPF